MNANPVAVGAIAGLMLAAALVGLLESTSGFRARIHSRLARGSGASSKGEESDLALSGLIQRAGLAQALSSDAVRSARLFLSAAALWSAITLTGFPGGDGAAHALQLVAAFAGWSLPGLLLRRRARLRARMISGALPDVFGSTARALAAGLTPLEALSATVVHRRDPLSSALQSALMRIGRGEAPTRALHRIQSQCPDPRVAGFVAALDGARKHGTNAAAPIRAMAVAVRAQERSERAGRSARAAPLIQLVVALMLVPSVLLLIGAVVLARVAS